MTPPVCTDPQPLPLLDLPADEPLRGLGRLILAVEERRVSLPLRKVDISARVADRVAEVAMEQSFRNPHADSLEAVYIFPLPGGAAVSRFELRVGDRVIEGRVQERAEARRQYREAIAQGHRAALLEEERDDVFTVQIGNLPAGEEVRVRLVYSERLPFFEDGSTEIRLPLVVAPRYIPGTPVDREGVGEGVEPDTDVVPDASRITPPRLAPGFNPGVDLKLAVDLVAAGSSGLSDLRCSQHSTRLRMESGGVRVELARVDERLNRDFVLRWRLAGQAVKPRLLMHRDVEGRHYGLLTVVPPAREGFLGTARDVVFVLDRSGSMEGVKMTSAARACAVLLETLGPRDRFAIQAFDDRYEWFEPHGSGGSRFLHADEAGLERGARYLRGIDARGGTELDGAMREALAAIDSRGAASGRVPVVVLLTDGQVGDESRVLRRLQQQLGDTRVFTVGIDTAVNESFLNRLAAIGGGTATFVTPGSAVEEALRDVGREIGVPLVVDLRLVDLGCGLEADSLAPARIPDLFAGRASSVFFRGGAAGQVRVEGRRADGSAYSEVVAAELVELPALSQLWARTRVTDLEDRFRIRAGDPTAVRAQIVDLAVHHSLLTRFTAFVVVDTAEVVNAGGQNRTVVQPVEMPEAWDMAFGAAHASIPAGGAMPCHPPRPSPSAMPCPPPPCPAPASFSAKRSAQSMAKEEEAAVDVQARGGRMRGAGAAESALPLGSNAAPSQAPGSYARSGALLPPSPPPGRSVSPAPRKADREARLAEAIPQATLLQVVADFDRALADAIQALREGRVPGPIAVERARKALLQALAASDRGADVPLLQRFLRSAAVELVAALETPGVTAPLLLSLFERHLLAFTAARSEAATVWGSSPSPAAPESPFWEGSV